MRTYAEKISVNEPRSAQAVTDRKQTGQPLLQFVDNRPEALYNRNLQAIVAGSPKVKQLKTLQDMVNRGIVQRKLVDLGDGFVALDEEEESLVNDGTEKYKLLKQIDGMNLLEDDWGDPCFYDPTINKKYSLLKQHDTVSLFGAVDKVLLFDTAKNEIYKGGSLNAKVASILLKPATIFGFSKTPPPPTLMVLVLDLIAREPSAGRGEAAKPLQTLGPHLIPHSPKNYPRGKVTVTQGHIANGATPGSGYIFTNGDSKLSVAFNGTELGFITIVKRTGKDKIVDVDVLEVHEPYRGMNISRILMVMLARAAQEVNVPTYRVGFLSDITNKPYWAQYDTNVVSLLARGDHQNMEVPLNPLH